jgi:hypothetical protein
MSFIHPTSEEGRLVHVLKSSFRLRGNQCLVFLGNVAHAGATHALRDVPFPKPLWPALHGHIDIIGEPRRIGFLTFYDEGMTHLDAQMVE